MNIHEHPDWPNFRWDHQKLAAPLADVRHRQGRLIGRMEALGFPLRQEAVLRTLTDDVLKTSEIEGEKLDAGEVRSSLARRLGMDVAAWRTDSTGPMTVVSGPLSGERIHFEAPAAARLANEMRTFLEWINSGPATDPVLRAALAHLWFVTIHPFDDGNGRIARAIADMLLARSENSPQRFYSMSAQIRAERGDYYDVLERSQKGPLDVTPWMEWFLGCLGRAIDAAQSTLGTVLAKARFWERHRDVSLNDRQRAVVSRMLDGFEGKLTTSKYAKLASCSQDTAARDIHALMEHGMLARSPAGGRSTSYELVLER